MMKVKLIVEGKGNDKDFFDNVLKLPGNDFHEEIEVISGGGKYEAVDIAKTYIRLGFNKIGLARDIDQNRIENLIDKIRGELSSGNFTVEEEKPWLKINKSKVLPIPVGLPGDDLLKKFGVNRFAHEDYLLKIFLLNIESKERLKRKIKLERRKNKACDRSKDILDLAMELSLLTADYRSTLLKTDASTCMNVVNTLKDNLEILKDP